MYVVSHNCPGPISGGMGGMPMGMPPQQMVPRGPAQGSMYGGPMMANPGPPSTMGAAPTPYNTNMMMSNPYGGGFAAPPMGAPRGPAPMGYPQQGGPAPAMGGYGAPSMQQVRG